MRRRNGGAAGRLKIEDGDRRGRALDDVIGLERRPDDWVRQLNARHRVRRALAGQGLDRPGGEQRTRGQEFQKLSTASLSNGRHRGFLPSSLLRPASLMAGRCCPWGVTLYRALG